MWKDLPKDQENMTKWSQVGFIKEFKYPGKPSICVEQGERRCSWQSLTFIWRWKLLWESAVTLIMPATGHIKLPIPAPLSEPKREGSNKWRLTLTSPIFNRKLYPQSLNEETGTGRMNKLPKLTQLRSVSQSPHTQFLGQPCSLEFPYLPGPRLLPERQPLLPSTTPGHCPCLPPTGAVCFQHYGRSNARTSMLNYSHILHN